MKTRALLALLGASAVTVSAAAYYHSSDKSDAPKLMTTVATRGPIVQTVATTGTLEAVTTVQVGSQASGTVKALYADFNSRVKKGQVVAELDPALTQAQVDQAQASVTRSRADLESAAVAVTDAQTKLTRAQALWDRQLIPRQDFDTAETDFHAAEAARGSAAAQVVQAEATLKQNRVNLDHTIITAPIDGVVISRSVDVGQTVAASLSAPTLFVIANDLSRMQVNANVDESDVGRVAVGQPVTFRVDAYPQDVFSGTVTEVRINPVVDQNVVSYVTIIDVPNPDLKLKPGMTANVTITVARDDNALRVPTSALRYRPDADTMKQPHVWVLLNGQQQLVPVRPGITDGATTAILTGLAEGATVVTGTMAAAQAKSTPSAPSPFVPTIGRRF